MARTIGTDGKPKYYQIRLNGNAITEWGLRMGDGFIETLTEPLTLKEPIVNESRLEHGKRYIIDDTPKFDSRELTLDFVIEADTPERLMKNKSQFLQVIYKGKVELSVAGEYDTETKKNRAGVRDYTYPSTDADPYNNDTVFRLVYLGKGTEYAMNWQRTCCHMMLKFVEPDPTNREPYKSVAGKPTVSTVG